MSSSGEVPTAGEPENRSSKDATTTIANDADNDVNRNNKRDKKTPRPKRNRKRPRFEKNSLPESVSHKVHVYPLALDGRPIHGDASTWIRAIEPYPFTFSTFAKARWLGRTILDVFCDEFGSYPRSYYESAIVQGRILVSDQIVSVDHKIKGADVLTHTVHRHEPGVAVSLKDPPYLKILQETEKVVVVDKPSTLPIHPCGGYHIQSLMSMLEPTFGKLYTIHRLDRLTSGLVILGKTTEIAKEWGTAIMDRNCEKVYLARVAGKFPMNTPEGLSRFREQDQIPDHGEFQNVCFSAEDKSKPKGTESTVLARKRNAHGYWMTNWEGALRMDCELKDVFDSQHSEDEWLDSTNNAKMTSKKDLLWFHLACPTRIAQHKDGICEAGSFEELDDALYSKTVKPAETAFGVVRYDQASDSTLVICLPRTGRTHQIRLHLQHLGHSIANDPNYGGDIWYGNAQGKEACRIAQERLDAIAATNRVSETTGGSSTATIDVPATEDEIMTGVVAAVRQEQEDIHEFIKRTCVWCARSRNTIGDTPRDLLEFLVRSPGIWLHAFQYKFEDSHDGAPHHFRSPIPKWAELPQCAPLECNS